MKVISAEEVHSALSYPELVDSLQEAYGGKYSMPPRQVFLLDENTNNDAFAVLPSWNDQFIGVKAFTYFPEAEAPYKSLYSKILLFNREHGEPLALVDGTTVTFWRTAGISGLATRLLSREDSETMLLLGTGNLAPYIIRANLSVRPLKRVMVWGRNLAKAEAVVETMQKEFSNVEFSAIEDRQTACSEADIVVAATGSHEPIVLGEWIKPGTHTDFIGNHHADKRECDTDLITKARVYADSRVNAFKEAGEILVPIKEGVFAKEGIIAELSEMCRGDAVLRENEEEVTLFKSIGMAMSDLVGAGLAYNEVIKN
ncbi:MAG: ornithine cyclodeaminase family protein [Verrucomicrobiota bacterium]|nr:ornithine cyclodeaminase family protein [Verrucomicrobiota bacterium]MEC9326491.1 ornithine cyclodeaminase family protein [Verrucomicrobiota bacterium]MED6299174.1 ornithine cyclodeaminase family protein [Verrucomicrobiota bacterium]